MKRLPVPDQDIRLAVDAVVFGYANNALQVLLIKQKFGGTQAQWALAGGFVRTHEGITEAVIRELNEETGLRLTYLEQLYTFGDTLNRDPRGRVVTVAYFALVNALTIAPKADTDALEAAWFPENELPPLAFDHKEIVAKARERLRAKLTYQPIGFELLEKTFPFSDLENLYCTLLGKEIDRRNFRKKIMAFGLVVDTGQQVTGKSGRPARLFRFDKKKYQQLAKDGFIFEISFA
ncbi:MAG: NUDIX hydrolase [Sphingobacteriales bacterium]|nr:MAG: NUDIX hydrolase [Sphingobacteriales bacterium]